MSGCCLESSLAISCQARYLRRSVWLLIGKRIISSRKTSLFSHMQGTNCSQNTPSILLLLAEHLVVNKCMSVYDQVHYESWLWTWRIIYSMRKWICSQPAHQSLDVFIVKIAQHAGYRVLNVHMCFIAAASIYALSSVGLEFKNIFPWQSTQNKR